MPADLAVRKGVEGALHEAVLAPKLGPVGDVAQGASDRSRAVEGALGSAQHFDPVHVEQVEVGREQRQRDHRIVQIDADLLLDAGLVPDDLTGGDAAHGNLALAWPEILHGHAGKPTRQVLDPSGVGPRHFLRGLRSHGERHILNPRAALGGRHHHFLDFARRLLRRLGLRCGRQRREKERRNRPAPPAAMAFHCALDHWRIIPFR